MPEIKSSERAAEKTKEELLAENEKLRRAIARIEGLLRELKTSLARA